jgi:hypothetical protein
MAQGGGGTGNDWLLQKLVDWQRHCVAEPLGCMANFRMILCCTGGL